LTLPHAVITAFRFLTLPFETEGDGRLGKKVSGFNFPLASLLFLVPLY
jgi:hypothetical protein